MNKIFKALIIKLLISFFLYLSSSNLCAAKKLPDKDQILKKGKFVEGTIYFENDSFRTEILLPEGKLRYNYYLQCVAKINSDSIKFFKPEEILGYKMGKELYEKHSKEGQYFFIHKVKSGKIDLYERGKTPSDKRYLYYLRIPSYTTYFVINPYEENVIEYQTQSNDPEHHTVTTLASKDIPSQFKSFIIKHMADCEKVKNMVMAEIYTINDIPKIVEEYNNCFK